MLLVRVGDNLAGTLGFGLACWCLWRRDAWEKYMFFCGMFSLSPKILSSLLWFMGWSPCNCLSCHRQMSTWQGNCIKSSEHWLQYIFFVSKTIHGSWLKQKNWATERSWLAQTLLFIGRILLDDGQFPAFTMRRRVFVMQKEMLLETAAWKCVACGDFWFV